MSSMHVSRPAALAADLAGDVPMGDILMEVERGDGEVLKVDRPARLGGP
jgi:hypothetical protein